MSGRPMSGFGVRPTSSGRKRITALRRATLVLWADYCGPLGRPLRTIPDRTRPRCRLYSLTDIELALAAARDAADEYVIDGVRWVWVDAAARRHGVSRKLLLRLLKPPLPSGTRPVLVRHPSGEVRERLYVRADEVDHVGQERSGVRAVGKPATPAARPAPAAGAQSPVSPVRQAGAPLHRLAAGTADGAFGLAEGVPSGRNK